MHNVYRTAAAAFAGLWVYLFMFAWQDHHQWTVPHFAVLTAVCLLLASSFWLAYRLKLVSNPVALVASTVAP